MKLQTRVPLTKTTSPVTYGSKLLLLGSCFVTNMAERLRYYKFNTLENPFGILYQPYAILNLLQRSVNKDRYTAHGLFENNGAWHSFDAHSELNKPSAAALQLTLNEALDATLTALTQCTHLFITLGTAWAYRIKESGALAANCHKVPQSQFNKVLLPIEAIRENLQAIISEVRSINPGIQIIFTISPVRHLKDGFIGNQRGKAHLISALHEVLENLVDPALWYFPAYEIQMDELRDYRFYNSDMVHPNTLAADYIWEVFRKCWISEDAYPVMDQVQEIRKGLQHKPFNPGSKEYAEFRLALDAKIASLQKKYPDLTFES